MDLIKELEAVDPHGPCYDLPRGVSSAMLEPDSVGVPAAPVDIRAKTLSADNPKLWLPSGVHAGLKIEHDHRVQTGLFVGPANWKLCWHITVSGWEAVDAMRDTLHDKHAEVHFVVGARKGQSHPVVIQCLPLDQFGKGLVHASGRAETNRAHVIQVEICAQPEDMKNFKHYRVLANLTWLLTHGEHPRVPIKQRLTADMNSPRRHSDTGWQVAEGHTGHDKCPQNIHFDPTLDFEDTKLMKLVESAPHDL